MWVGWPGPVATETPAHSGEQLAELLPTNSPGRARGLAQAREARAAA